jgi:4-hydroxythreonine-4-phosphate dehydrogenase
MHTQNPLILAITMGDACGIGPEIVLKACMARTAQAEGARWLVYGDPGVLQRQAKALGLPAQIIRLSDPSELAGIQPSKQPTLQIPVIACSELPPDLPIGQVDARAGHAAHAAIVRASRDAIAHKVAAVVTAPIHKEALHAAGIRHPGHTEILAELAGVPNVRMMLANDELRTILVTIHVSLREAIEGITYPAVLETLQIADDGLKRLGLEHPRIAVAGLNPHAGEGGLMGREEIEIIAPAIAAARAQGIDASGPWPGDTIFMRARGFREFDLVVAMYHDQGLIPVKYLGLDEGVNVTVGLPFVRTSVDHGTAFDIAGQGIADHRSLLAAIEMAIQLARPIPS